MSKLILTNEVAGLGSAGDVVEVKDGFARNYLIPQGFAVAWSRGGEKQVASIRAARDARAIHDHEDAVSLKNSLEPKRRPSAPALTARRTLFDSSEFLSATASSWSWITRDSRAARIDATCFSPPRDHATAKPWGMR